MPTRPSLAASLRVRYFIRHTRPNAPTRAHLGARANAPTSPRLGARAAHRTVAQPKRSGGYLGLDTFVGFTIFFPKLSICLLFAFFGLHWFLL